MNRFNAFVTTAIMIGVSSTAHGLSGLGLTLDTQVSVGGWLVNWEQQSSSANRFGSEAIQMDYSIDNAMAYTGELSLAINGIAVPKLEYVKVSDDSGKELSRLAVGLNWLIGDFDFYGRYEKASFNGKIYGSTATSYGSGDFETDLRVADLMIYYKKRYGVVKIKGSVPLNIIQC